MPLMRRKKPLKKRGESTASAPLAIRTEVPPDPDDDLAWATYTLIGRLEKMLHNLPRRAAERGELAHRIENAWLACLGIEGTKNEKLVLLIRSIEHGVVKARKMSTLTEEQRVMFGALRAKQTYEAFFPTDAALLNEERLKAATRARMNRGGRGKRAAQRWLDAVALLAEDIGINQEPSSIKATIAKWRRGRREWRKRILGN